MALDSSSQEGPQLVMDKRALLHLNVCAKWVHAQHRSPHPREPGICPRQRVP